MTDHERLIKAIYFKATHRGSKEVDHIVLRFVESLSPNLNLPELEALKTFLDQDDIALFSAVRQRDPAFPANTFVQFLIDIGWVKDKLT